MKSKLPRLTSRSIIITLAVIGLAFGGPVRAADQSRGRGLSADQVTRLRAFSQVTHFSADPSGIPTAITGRLGYIGFGPAEHSVHGYLATLLPLLKGGGEEQFRNLRVQRDKAGVAHLRMEEQFRGLPIVGAELVVHVNEITGEVTGVNGRFAPAVGLPVSPGIDRSLAMTTALRETSIAAPKLLETPYLTYVLDPAGSPHLAWAARVEYKDQQGYEQDRLFADATDGHLIAKHGLIMRAKYRKIYDAGHGTSLPGTLLFQEGGSSSDVDAQKAYEYTGNAYDYFSGRQGRDSWDGSGGQLISTVHYSSSYNNAFWNGSQLVFGDGDGTQFIGFARGLDVVAHELTHGVTQQSAGLIYANESGALNEAMSDIFGAATEANVRGLSSDTWKVGEDIKTPGTSGDALRYMNNPTQDGSSTDYYPERYTGSADNGGVHSNSGIGNLAFYLLSQGGSHPRSKTTVSVSGIGMTSAEDIFYRALTAYMGASTGFQDARDNTIQAASDLFGPCSSQTESAGKAWDAVGAPRSPGHDDEPNNSPTDATALQPYSSYNVGYLCSSGDSDWFSVNKVSSYSGLTIDLYPPSNGDYDLELWQGGQRDGSYNTGNGAHEGFTWYYGSGIFYIRVIGKNGSSSTTSPYSLAVYQ
ncbi:MAG: bacillolysin [Acidobacteriota bacterium]|jgi:vibriolysin|nr:bacillolysin [Acidobacteriota bacterium]